ncbi:MAG: hypothetical protein ABSH23_02140 [Steroidobacteraceae bacterium]|jgi:hypothetical protein
MSTRREFNARPPIERIPGQTRHKPSCGGGRDSAGSGPAAGGVGESPPSTGEQAEAPRRNLEIGLSASTLNSAMREWK